MTKTKIIEAEVGYRFKYNGELYEAKAAVANSHVCSGCVFDRSALCYKVSGHVDCTENHVIFQRVI